MRQVVEKNFCDRPSCKNEIHRRNCEIIENMTFNWSGYQDSGSGGNGYKNQEFCPDCSRDFIKFWRGKEPTNG